MEMRKCRQCDATAVVLLQKKDPICRECFIRYVYHKFRSILARTPRVKSSKRILVAYSGGPSSSALLDMIHYGSEDEHKRLRFDIETITVDESIALDWGPEKRNSWISDLSSSMSQYNMPKWIVPLENSYRPTDHNPVAADPTAYSLDSYSNAEGNQVYKDRFKDAIRSIKSLTNKLEFIRRLRINLIVDFAASHDFDFVMEASSGTRLAIDLLSDISLGRGDQVESQCGTLDRGRYPVPIVRPLREIISKDIALYNVFRRVATTSGVEPTLITKSDANSSIQRATETFVLGLIPEFPSTVYTVTSIANKLKPPSSTPSHSDETKCALCSTRLKDRSLAWHSLSHSLALVSQRDNEVSSDSENSGPNLCYGCSIIASELDSEKRPAPHLESRFPPYVTNSTTSVMLVPESIKNFLLETD